MTATPLKSFILIFCASVLLLPMNTNAQSASVADNSPTGTAAAALTPLTIVIGLGDSLTHGTMDGTNNYLYTWNAYLQKVNDALNKSLPSFLSQPYFDLQENRIYPSSISTNLGVDGADIFSVEGIEYYKRVGASQSYVSTDLLCDALSPDSFNSKYDKVLYPINLSAGNPASQLDSAIWLLNSAIPAAGLNKALVFFWLGNNDSSLAALGAGGSNPTFQPIPFDLVSQELDPFLNLLIVIAQLNGELSFEPYTMSAIDRNLTTLADFSAQYDHVVSRLVNDTASSSVSKEIFLLTLPYYSSVGYLMDSEDIEFYLDKIDPSYSVPATFKRVAPRGQPITNPTQGDRISLLTFGMMYALLSTGHSVAEVNGALEVNGQQRDGLVLSEAEQQYIMSRIDGFNNSIKTAASSYGPHVHVIDIGAILNLALTGQLNIVAGNKTLTRKWVRGSSFTLDGVHPGLTGQALVADYILLQLNQILGTNAPLYNLSKVIVNDPYIDKDGDGWAPGPNYAASGLTQLLFLFRDPDDNNPGIQPVLPPDIWTQISNILLNEVTSSPAISAEASRLRNSLPASP
jgi:hypothetical protein